MWWQKYYEGVLEEQAPSTLVWSHELQRYEDDVVIINILLWGKRVRRFSEVAKKLQETIALEGRDIDPQQEHAGFAKAWVYCRMGVRQVEDILNKDDCWIKAG